MRKLYNSCNDQEEGTFVRGLDVHILLWENLPEMHPMLHCTKAGLPPSEDQIQDLVAIYIPLFIVPY